MTAPPVPPAGEEAQPVLIGRGHPNIRATHGKSLEFIEEPELSERGTCIVGVACRIDRPALRRLRGPVLVILRCGETEDRLTALVNPLHRSDDPLILRTHPDSTHRCWARAAVKGAADLDRRLIACLQNDEARLAVWARPLALGPAEKPASAGALWTLGLPSAEAPAWAELRLLTELDAILLRDDQAGAGLLRHWGFAGLESVALPAAPDPSVGRLLDRLHRGARMGLLIRGLPTPAESSFVDAALERGIRVSAPPGADPLSAALRGAGLAVGPVSLIDPLPRSRRERQSLLTAFARLPGAVVWREPAARLAETLALAAPLWPERRAALATPGEPTRRGHLDALSQAAAMLRQDGSLVTVVVERRSEPAVETAADFDRFLRVALEQGAPLQPLARALAASTGVGRREAFARLQALKDSVTGTSCR